MAILVISLEIKEGQGKNVGTLKINGQSFKVASRLEVTKILNEKISLADWLDSAKGIMAVQRKSQSSLPYS